MSHTPGPWVVKRCDLVVADPDSGFACELLAPWGKDGHSDLTACEANARLIAAAPELLAVVKNCVHFFENNPGLFRAAGKSHDRWMPLVSDARNALEKASRE